MKKFMMIVLILAVAVMAGCASYTVQSVPSQLDENKIVKAEKDDISVTAFPILTEEDSKRYFDANLPRENVMAIYVNILNTSPNIVEIIASNLIVHSRQQSIEPLPIEKVYKVVKRNWVGRSAVWMLGLYVAAPISAIHTASVNKDVEQDLKGKVLKIGDVIKSKTFTQGFLWFKLPDDVALEEMGDKKLALKMIFKKDGKLVECNLPIKPSK
ncbi:MAG: hypothetical protein Q8K51_14840 [Nitrospirota bacterium]|nr:hypothetical protein [Nitrospirota bacterium]